MSQKIVFTRTLKIMFRRKETPEKAEVATVRDLETLGGVAEKFDSGEYLPHTPSFTFDRQIWTALAVHTGLAMRVKEDAGFLNVLNGMADDEEELEKKSAETVAPAPAPATAG